MIHSTVSARTSPAGLKPSVPPSPLRDSPQWVELAETKDGAPAEMVVEILTEVADLARIAGDLGQPLYCWYFAS